MRNQPHRTRPNGSWITFSHAGLIQTRPPDARRPLGVTTQCRRRKLLHPRYQVLAPPASHHRNDPRRSCVRSPHTQPHLFCYSWYDVVVPRPHHTLITSAVSLHKDRKPVHPDDFCTSTNLASIPWSRSYGVVETAPTTQVFPTPVQPLHPTLIFRVNQRVSSTSG